MTSHRIDIGPHTLDLATGEFHSNVGVEKLSETEAALVAYLARDPQRVVPKDELLREVWGYHESARSRTIDTTLSRLRKKLPEGYLSSYRGRGIQLSLPTEPTPESPVAVPIGRAEAARTLLDAIRSPGLITVTGPPGVGKTHLARWLLANHPGVMVHLRSSSTAAQVVSDVAGTLGMPPSTSVSGVAQKLDTLLVLDGGTRIPADLVATLETWQAAGRIVLTSEHPVGLPSEQVLRLDPLSKADALAMLAQLGAPTTGALRELVSAGNRLPLELELAATVLPFLGAEALTERSLLEIDDPRVNRPYASLRQALQRSWDRLSTEDQHLLATLSVFQDRFEVASAAFVANVPPYQVLGGLQRLHRASMLSGSAGVFSLHSSVRSFATEHAGPEALKMRDAWAATLLDQLMRGNDVRARRHAVDVIASLKTATQEQAAPLLLVMVFYWATLWADAAFDVLNETKESRPDLAASCVLVEALLLRLAGKPFSIDTDGTPLPQLEALKLALMVDPEDPATLERYQAYLIGRHGANITSIAATCSPFAPVDGLKRAQIQLKEGRFLAAAALTGVELREMLYTGRASEIVARTPQLIKDGIANWTTLAAAELELDNPEGAIALLKRGLEPGEISEPILMVKGALATVLVGLNRREEALALIDDPQTGQMNTQNMDVARHVLGLPHELAMVPPPLRDWTEGKPVVPGSPRYQGAYFAAWMLSRL